MRIVGGRWRGRRLVAPTGRNTRPTADRVREALFSILYEIPAQILDLYAGTGAVGLEALSRGAKHATFVERARPAQAALEANIAALTRGDGASSVEVLAMSVQTALTRLERDARSFGLVFADPPYPEASALTRVAVRIAPRVEVEGTLVFELSSRDTPPPAPNGFCEPNIRTYGEAALAIYRRAQ